MPDQASHSTVCSKTSLISQAYGSSIETALERVLRWNTWLQSVQVCSVSWSNVQGAMGERGNWETPCQERQAGREEEGKNRVLTSSISIVLGGIEESSSATDASSAASWDALKSILETAQSTASTRPFSFYTSLMAVQRSFEILQLLLSYHQTTGDVYATVRAPLYRFIGTVVPRELFWFVMAILSAQSVTQFKLYQLLLSATHTWATCRVWFKDGFIRGGLLSAHLTIGYFDCFLCMSPGSEWCKSKAFLTTCKSTNIDAIG